MTGRRLPRRALDRIARQRSANRWRMTLAEKWGRYDAVNVAMRDALALARRARWRVVEGGKAA